MPMPFDDVMVERKSIFVTHKFVIAPPSAEALHSHVDLADVDLRTVR